MIKTSSHWIAAAAAAAIAFAICYGQIIASLVDTWSTNPLYSYGFAVPLISAYIVWTRGGPSNLVMSPDYRLGVPLMVAGVVMLVVGHLGAIIGIDYLSLVVSFAGVMLLLFGRDVVKRHWFALAYLLIMVPIWGLPIARLQDPSRLLSTDIAMAILGAIGVPALQQGTNIILPAHTIAVLRECSGVNQLVALVAMVLPAAYLWLGSNVRRGALLCMSIVVSFLGNGLRIALVSWLAYRGFGDGALTGNAHLMQGLLVSTFGYVVIGGILSLLASGGGAAAEPDAAPEPRHVAPSFVVHRRFWLDGAVVVLMLAAAATRVSATPLNVSLTADLASLEDRIGGWTQEIGPRAPWDRLPGIDDDLVDVGRYPSENGERRFTGVDSDLLRAYVTPEGERVQLYVGYYGRQQAGKELAGDASEALSAAATPLVLASDSGSIPVNEIVIEKGARKRGLIFWYSVNGRTTSDIYRAKIYTILDAFTDRTTNGSVVMIAWDAHTAGAGAAREHAIDFARAVMPLLRRHLPS